MTQRNTCSRIGDEAGEAESSDSASFENSRVGKYFVWNRIDQGGQASVYRGWDPELQREVALKIGNQKLQEEFGSFEEGILLARICSPFVAEVYDTGIFDGYGFLVMEYIEGFNLHQVAASRELSPKEILRIVSQVAQAVGSAHARGVLHLDLKPENVMLTNANKVKLIDFGAGWRMPLHINDLGDPGWFTPEFAAPEQLAGALDPVDVRTDIYGLSALLWFLLTKSPPEPWNSELQTRIMKSSQERHLFQVASRGLSESRDDRYQDTDAFLRALKTRGRSSAYLAICLGIVNLVIGVLNSTTLGDLVPRQSSPVPEIVTNLEVVAPPTNEVHTYIYMWETIGGVKQIMTTRKESPHAKIHKLRFADLPEKFAILALTSAADPVAVDQAAKLACAMSRRSLAEEWTAGMVLDSKVIQDNSPATQALIDSLTKTAKHFHLGLHNKKRTSSICVNLDR